MSGEICSATHIKTRVTACYQAPSRAIARQLGGGHRFTPIPCRGRSPVSRTISRRVLRTCGCRSRIAASCGRRTSSNGCSSKNGEAENPALHGIRAAPDRRRQKRRPRALTSSPHRYLRCTSGTHSGIRLGFAIDFKCCYAARAAKEAYYCSLPQASSVIDQEIKHLNIENVQPRRRA
jgi:hypothetical protein